MDQKNFESCLTCVKNLLIKNRNPRCTSVTHETPILKIWALSKLNSVLWTGYGTKKI